MFAPLPAKIIFEHQTDTLHRMCLFQRVLVHGVCVGFRTPMPRRTEHILHVQITKQWLVADVVITVSEVAVDQKPVVWLVLELGLIFLAP